jgi:iron complex outermembrane receptor protein
MAVPGSRGKNGKPRISQEIWGFLFYWEAIQNGRNDIMKLFKAVMLSLLISANAGAQNLYLSQNDAEDYSVKLDEIIVSASRYQENIRTVPANVTVITAENIKNSTARNIPDLLRSQAGIHVNDITGNGRSFSVDLRGFGASAATNTLVLVDGRRVNQPDLSGTDWSLISLDRVQRIEIIRGGRGSVLYGDNASGGVINIITKQGKKFEAVAEIMAGSYDTLDTSASVSSSTEKFSYALSGRYAESDGYRDNSETEYKDMGGNLTWFVTDHLDIDFSSDYHKDNARLPGSILKSELSAGVSRTDSLTPRNFADVEDYYFKAVPRIYFLTDSLFKTDISYRKRSSVFDITYSGGTFLGDTDIKTMVMAPQLIIKENIFNRNNTLTIGFDYEKAKEDITNTSDFFGSRTVGTFDLEKENTAYYIYDEFKPFEPMALSAGFRYDRARFEFDPGTPDHVTLDEKLYNAGINYNYYKNSYAYFGYARSFRYPVLDEFFNFSTNAVDTELTSQTSNDYELGFRHYLTDNFFVHANVFHMDTRDEIFFNVLTYSNENLDGKTRRQGLELVISKTFNGIKLEGTYSYTDAEIRSGRFSGKQIPNVAEHQAGANAEFSLGDNFTIALNSVYVGERPFDGDFANEFDDQEDYILVNAKLKYQLKKYVGFINLNNITNEKYSEYGVISGFPSEEAFYPSPRFNFVAGISAEF